MQFSLRGLLLASVVSIAFYAPPHSEAQFPQLPEDYDLPGGPPANALAPDGITPPPLCPLNPNAIMVTSSVDPSLTEASPETYFALTPEGEKLSCLQTLIDDIHAACLECVDCYQRINSAVSECYNARNGYYRSNCVPGTYNYERLIDDCFFGGFLAAIGEGGGGDTLDAIAFGENPIPYWYLDSSCNPLAPDDPAAINACSGMHITWINSPISLLWDQSQDLGNELSFVNFPLRPGSEDAWYTWKASGAAPLLVYDPEHEGRITAASQLFGNWTFGGKRLASNTNAANGQTPLPWNDGFEALATLDSDRSGAVEGAELEPLGLWFDYDRDGVSGPGEVQRLAALSVIKLYYQPERKDPITGDIFASRGFERAVSGGSQIGAAVDWFAHGGLTKSSLILQHSLDAHEAPYAATNSSSAEANSNTIDSPSQADDRTFHNWRWEVDTDHGGSSGHTGAGGTLMLEEFKDGSVQGFSLFELPIAQEFKNSGKRVRSILKRANLCGSVKNGADQARMFELTAEEEGNRTESVVTLLATGEIRGESKLTVMSGEKDTSLRYTWHGRVIISATK